VVKISTDTNKKLIKICENGFPNEVCGVLVGKITGDNYDRYDILDFAACKNLNTERAVDRYELDPRDYMLADKEASSKGHEIIGIYHSHPNHPAIASKTDKLFAQERYIYLIYSIYEKEYKNLIGWVLNKREDKMDQILIEIS
tara:strand:- start:3672 stop:4100 length:429 start_codon:yes stop_codon:yes gene_type:complete